jgi:hypothetical protein
MCKLTLEEGKFVKSHLIPAALTKPDAPGEPFYQGGYGAKPSKKWSSWYDQELVIRKGEDVLASYDTWAIAELRRLRLVWSGWQTEDELTDHLKIPDTPWGARKVETEDPAKLRLFFLSLLWRAAASSRWEFGEVWLPQDHLEQLRAMVLDGEGKPNSFYPIQLTQISTKGRTQNLVPIAIKKPIPPVGDAKPMVVDAFRFYMEGLIAHFARPPFDEGLTQELGSLVVGNEKSITLSTVTYEQSFQRQNLETVIFETRLTWPSVKTPGW